MKKKDYLLLVCFTVLTILLPVGWVYVFKYCNDRDNKDRVYLNEDHTLCHFKDTVNINGTKYLKVYDTTTGSWKLDYDYLIKVDDLNK